MIPMTPNAYDMYKKRHGMQESGMLSEDQGIAPLALAGAGLLSEQEAVGQPQAQVQKVSFSTPSRLYGNGDEFWKPRNAHAIGSLTDQMGPFMGGLYKMTMMRGDNPTYSGTGFENVDQPIQTFRNFLSSNLGGDWAKLNANREPMAFEELL